MWKVGEEQKERCMQYLGAEILGNEASYKIQ
jgi:hypothetical protein